MVNLNLNADLIGVGAVAVAKSWNVCKNLSQFPFVNALDWEGGTIVVNAWDASSVF